MPARTYMLWMLIPWMAACGQVDASPASSEEDQKAPYQISIVSQESCPLPVGLNPKRVTILSYKVRLTSHTSTGVPANYFYASLLTRDGSRYLSGFEGCSPLLAGDPLIEGESVVGFLNFALPPSQSPETLEFSPELLKGETAVISRLPLASGTATPEEEFQ